MSTRKMKMIHQFRVSTTTLFRSCSSATSQRYRPTKSGVGFFLNWSILFSCYKETTITTDHALAFQLTAYFELVDFHCFLLEAISIGVEEWHNNLWSQNSIICCLISDRCEKELLQWPSQDGHRQLESAANRNNFVNEENVTQTEIHIQVYIALVSNNVSHLRDANPVNLK